MDSGGWMGGWADTKLILILTQIEVVVEIEVELVRYCWYGQMLTGHTGCFKKNCTVFILHISRQPSFGFSNPFFLLKTEINMQILNAKPFLCDLRGPGYLQNKMRLQGVSKTNCTVFILHISRQPSFGFSNPFFLLKTEINMQILKAKPFLCDLRGPGYL